mmetsp:Transcript_38229/g.89479  ORF Transcript_38229/g.89479 Transcript_38229/m.89479 type:complete len:192 (-) Transcript_38229:152-727(-)
MGGISSIIGARAGKANYPKLSDEEVDELTVITSFTSAEIERLWILFNGLEVGGNGTISPQEMLKLPQLRFNPLGQRVIAVSKFHASRYSFRDFLQDLAVFSPQAPYEVKLHFAFKVFDVDGDGKLGRYDLRCLLRALVPPEVTAMDDALVEQIVTNALEEADQDYDHSLDYKEFKAAVAHSDIASKLTISF